MNKVLALTLFGVTVLVASLTVHKAFTQAQADRGSVLSQICF